MTSECIPQDGQAAGIIRRRCRVFRIILAAVGHEATVCNAHMTEHFALHLRIATVVVSQEKTFSPAMLYVAVRVLYVCREKMLQRFSSCIDEASAHVRDVVVDAHAGLNRDVKHVEYTIHGVQASCTVKTLRM